MKDGDRVVSTADCGKYFKGGDTGTVIGEVVEEDGTILVKWDGNIIQNGEWWTHPECLTLLK